MHTEFSSLEQLSQLNRNIQMKPLDRFNLDYQRIYYLMQDEFIDEVFFVEEEYKVSKVNVFSINNHKLECPVDLREKTVLREHIERMDSHREYAVVDATGRVMREDKRGYIEYGSPILTRLMIDDDIWIELTHGFESCFGSAVGMEIIERRLSQSASHFRSTG